MHSRISISMKNNIDFVKDTYIFLVTEGCCVKGPASLVFELYE